MPISISVITFQSLWVVAIDARELITMPRHTTLVTPIGTKAPPTFFFFLFPLYLLIYILKP